MSMSIKVRYFASLKEDMGCAEQLISADKIVTVADVWLKANKRTAMPENILTAVNMEYAGLNDLVSDGDEVAFFPPVTGG